MTMSRKRRSYEAGHKPKFLVVVDDTAECDRAVYYASRRAARIGGGVVMLSVIETGDRNQQWLGVADIMRAEAHEQANAVLERYAARANGAAAITPERVIREGDKVQEILGLIDQDEDIVVLTLAAGTGKEGPGPLVASLGKSAATFPIPVAIVPGNLDDDELDALS
jgi:nucleotide-binding universal stress UspA family protein